MDDDDTPTLPPDLERRNQIATVELAEANAAKAKADAQSSALTAAQTRYTGLIPDLTGTNTNKLIDSSTGVAFSGLVTYSALQHAAESVADQITALKAVKDREVRILVTTQPDLLTNDLLAESVNDGIAQLVSYAKSVLDVRKAADEHTTPDEHEVDPDAGGPFVAENFVGGAVGGVLAGAGAAALLPTVGGAGVLAAAGAAAAAIPSIISLFSSTTTAKDQNVEISDLAAVSAVMQALLDSGQLLEVAHEDFRLGPTDSAVYARYRQLVQERGKLLHYKQVEQELKNNADFNAADAQIKITAAQEILKSNAADPAATRELSDQTAVADEATKNSADAAAVIGTIDDATTSIAAFMAAVNSTSTGSRSPLAIAAMQALLVKPKPNDSGNGSGETTSSDDKPDGRFPLVLLVKGIGGQAEEFSKDRTVGPDTYTSLADAALSFMLLEVGTNLILRSGLATGVASVHGYVGKAPDGSVGPRLRSPLQWDTPDPDSPGSAQPPATSKHGRLWRSLFGE